MRLLVFGLLALVLIGLQMHASDRLAPLRAAFTYMATPLYWLSDLPERGQAAGERALRSRRELLEENSALRLEAHVLRARTQKMAALLSENARLRALLRSSAPIEESVLVAEIIGLSPDPRTHTVLVNRGEKDGVLVGQPVIDADGLMGQVIEVTPVSSRVLLITDPLHAVPVQINRNGVRAIAEGTGLTDALDLPHVAATVDVREGDLLESSGLGGRFPPGYPVARVVSVRHDPGKPFLSVRARPTAAIDRSRHVLIVFRGGIIVPAAVGPEPESGHEPAVE